MILWSFINRFSFLTFSLSWNVSCLLHFRYNTCFYTIVSKFHSKLFTCDLDFFHCHFLTERMYFLCNFIHLLLQNSINMLCVHSQQQNFHEHQYLYQYFGLRGPYKSLWSSKPWGTICWSLHSQSISNHGDGVMLLTLLISPCVRCTEVTAQVHNPPNMVRSPVCVKLLFPPLKPDPCPHNALDEGWFHIPSLCE